MSGIEAVFGLAASGAGLLSLSIQLVECATKLKRIYHAARDAPRTLSGLVFDLETMAMALRQLEQRRQQESPSETLLARCIMSCQQGTADIRRIVDSLEKSTTNTTGKVYFAFKQRGIVEMLDSLEKAKSSLELAYMMYQAEEQRRRDQAHADTLALQSLMIREMQAQLAVGNAQLSNQLQLVTQTSAFPHHQGKMNDPHCLSPFASETPATMVDAGDHPNCTNWKRSSIRRRKKSDARFRLTFRLPTWISRRIYDFALVQLESGWDMLLRTQNIIPGDSLIFQYVGAGNLEGIRKLFESRRATPLDVAPRSYSLIDGNLSADVTLLEAAASNGQVDACRYLLSLTTWPNHGTALSTALAAFSQPFQYRFREGIVEMYRMFMADADFNPDFDEGLRSGWLQYCDRVECLEVILQSQSLGLDSFSQQARFEVASRLEAVDTASFLRCVGLSPLDRRLASLSNSKGVTALHVVAKFVRNKVMYRWRQSNTELQQWLELGVSLLNNGAHPHRLKEQEEESWDSYTNLLQANGEPSPRPGLFSLDTQQATPLLECLGNSTWAWTISFSIERSLECLRIWMEMVQRAGLDLCDYGAKEYEIWHSGGIHDHLGYSSRMLISDLVYGPKSTDWSFRVGCRRLASVYRLRLPPGAFSEQTRVPTTISWIPTKKERDEGPWMEITNEEHVIDFGDARDLYPRSNDPFHALVDSYQDDSGPIMLMQYRSSRRPGGGLKRSHSQPPNLSRRQLDSTSAQLRCCPPYHFCPWDLSWKFGCVGGQWDDEDYARYEVSVENMEATVLHVRSCVEGVHTGRSLLQQSHEWECVSFLREITHCQDNALLTGRVMEHIYGCPSPEACRKVRVDRLNVPEDLRPYHPRRRVFEDEIDLE